MKYLCVCGAGFKNKLQADVHQQFNSGENRDYIGHLIVERNWMARLTCILCEFPWKNISRCIGVFIIIAIIFILNLAN